MIENPIVRMRYDFRHDADGNYLLFVHEIQPPQPENQKLMPDLFLKNWRELGIKYTLKVAVENGAAGVALATGQQQIDLYPSIEKVAAAASRGRPRWRPAQRGQLHTVDRTGGDPSDRQTRGLVVAAPRLPTPGTARRSRTSIGKEIAARILADARRHARGRRAQGRRPRPAPAL